MTVTEHPTSRTRAGAVRLCDRCGRPVAAHDKSEYTATRARLVVAKGLCVCPAPVPERGPSLI